MAFDSVACIERDNKSMPGRVEGGRNGHGGVATGRPHIERLHT